MSGPRYALYALAEPGSTLEAFGRAVLGYDNGTGQPVPHPADLQGLAEVTAGARVYGFHATLKAPMRLAPGVSEADLLAEARRLATDHPPVAVGALTVAALGQFLALVPVAPPTALGLLAAECVAALDPLRAPLTAAEIAKRQPERLTPRGRALLDRWGYPHVFEAFRFHMTLTDALPEEAVEGWRTQLADAYARSGAGPLTLGSVAILRQDGGAPFRVVERIPFGDRQG